MPPNEPEVWGEEQMVMGTVVSRLNYLFMYLFVLPKLFYASHRTVVYSRLVLVLYQLFWVFAWSIY